MPSLFADVCMFVPREGTAIPERTNWVLTKSLYATEMAFSQVWLAESGADRLVFKLISEHGINEEVTFPKGLRVEVAVWLRLRAERVKNIVELVDYLVAKSSQALSKAVKFAPFVATKYYPLGSLADVLSNRAFCEKHLQEREILRLVEQVAWTVHECHRAGVAHGDIRPANIFLEWLDEREKRLVALLADFGRSRFLDAAPRSRFLDAAPGSTPPALASGSPPPDPVGSAACSVAFETVANSGPILATPPAEEEQPQEEQDDLTPQERVDKDREQLGDLLYQLLSGVETGRLESNQPPKGWRRQIKCPVLQQILERAWDLGTAFPIPEFCDCLNRVYEERQKRYARRLVIVAAAAATFALLLGFASWKSWQLTKLTEKTVTQEVVHAAEVAMQAGAWEQVLIECGRALERPNLEPLKRVKLQLMRLRAATFLDDMETARKELSALEGQELGKYRGTFLFEKGLYHLELGMQELLQNPDLWKAEVTPHEKIAIEFLRQASTDPEVDRADQLTALGLLAQTQAESSRRFEEALAHSASSRFHPYATVYLVTNTFLSGRLEQALTRATVWAQMNPRSPAPALFRAVILSLMGRDSEAQATLKPFQQGGPHAGRLPADTLKGYEAAMHIIRAINEALDEALLSSTANVKLFSLLALNLSTMGGGTSQSGVFRAPFSPAQRRDSGRFLDVMDRGMIKPLQQKSLMVVLAGKHLSPAEAIQIARGLDQVGDFLAEGVVSYLRGYFRLMGNDRPGAAKAFESAANDPSIFDVRRIAWLGIAAFKLAEAGRKPAEADRFKREARVLLRQVCLKGPMSPALAAKVQEQLRLCGDNVLADDIRQMPSKK